MYSIYKCSVPYCGHNMSNKQLAFHAFPSRDEQRRQWIQSCGITKTLSSKSYVCSSHFLEEDYFPALVIAAKGSKKLLKRTAIPSVIPVEHDEEQISNDGCDNEPIPPEQEHTVRRKFVPSILRRNIKQHSSGLLLTNQGKTVMDGSNQEKENRGIVENDSESVTVVENDSESTTASPLGHMPDMIASDGVSLAESEIVGSVDANTPQIQEIIPDPTFGFDEAIEELEGALAEIEVEGSDEVSDEDMDIVRERGREFQQQQGRERLTLLDLIRNDEDLTAFTGIKTHLLDNLCKIVSKCEEKDLYYKKFALSARARIVMCLCKLRLNLSFRCLAVLFGINRKSSSHNVSYMIQLLAAILDQFIYWPSREQCTRSLPKCFSKFPKTRIVLDCTEIPVEKPHCLKCRLRWYSHYKGCETVKLLVGMDPCGVISYMSDSYGGRISDKEIFNQSGLLDRLDPGRDAIMVDKGFDIEIECLEAHIQLYIPPKLGAKPQLSPEESLLTNQIAAARVHVERVIQRMKLWKIMKDKITLTTLPYFDDIVKIVAALVNLKAPLLSDNKF
ncbi:hypothetical protein QAD02_013288 [Eretmocerus hayati]|uniref:Uncharacterized protein n=1 Tax=Eretmocerus hayati TaxID=131215 RepID=A0ACC2P3V4_9HYME|nr:hypothetical protein QAD02_013288 [Eretmocerus hayati]